tara:strand:+ start:1417 stop:2556 length:1140 start_codon:yes stop_codon:yes gene_type:complete
MKKILFRKLLIDCLKFFAISIIGASAIIWVFQAVNYLDIMVEDGRNFHTYFTYTLLTFPKIISKILPFIIFLSFYFVITRYEQNNELIIFWNFGVKKIELINFFLKFSIILTIFQILLTSIAVPKTLEIGRSLIKTSEVNFIDNFIKPKKFNDIIKDLTIYSENKDKDGNFTNIYLKKKLGPNEFEVTFAKKGTIKKKGNVEILSLSNGENLSFKNEKITNISFQESNFNLKRLKTNTTTYIKVQENSIFDLFSCYNNLIKNDLPKIKNSKLTNCSFENLINIFREFYKRLIIPFFIPVLILIASYLIISSKENLDYFKKRIYIFLFGMFMIIFSETSLRFIVDNFLENIKIVLLPFIILISLYSIIFLKLSNSQKIKI